MTGYRIELTCPHDGHPLEHVTHGTSDGYATQAVAHCPECGADVLIRVTLHTTNQATKRGKNQRESVAKARAVHADKINAARIAKAARV